MKEISNIRVTSKTETTLYQKGLLKKAVNILKCASDLILTTHKTLQFITY